MYKRQGHQNDPVIIRELLMDPGVWIMVGLSTNADRPAHSIARWLTHEQGRTVIPVHPKAETVFGETGYATLADVPDQDIKVVDCFVSSEHVGAVVDDVIAHKAVSYTHLRAHETVLDLVCRLLLEKKNRHRHLWNS